MMSKDASSIKQLIHSLTSTDNPAEHNRILRELEDIGGNKVYDALLGLLEAEPGELRYRVLSTLTGVDPDRAQHLLVNVMNNHQDSDMQWTASNLLINVATAEILDSLIDALQKHPNVRVRLSIVTVLDKLEDKRALPALKHARDHDVGKTDGGYSVRWLAEEAVQRIQSRTKDANGIQK